MSRSAACEAGIHTWLNTSATGVRKCVRCKRVEAFFGYDYVELPAEHTSKRKKHKTECLQLDWIKEV